MRYLVTVLLFVCSVKFADAQSSSLARADAIRISEAFSLADYVGDEIWKGWQAAPFAILLITPEKDFLINHPYPTDDFRSEGTDEILGMEVFSRASGTFSPNLLATFPAVAGVSTIVVGQAEMTGKSSTMWVLTLLHEHFHQYQTAWPDYYSGVNGLDLSGGDQTGMWMLNYPLPYLEDEVVEALHQVRDETLTALSSEDKSASLQDLTRTLENLKANVSEKDFRYLSFQLWQEGISRYTEELVAEMASSDYNATDAFAGLEDVISYTDALGELEETRSKEMATMDPVTGKRVVFYPLGASLGALLDRYRRDWRDDYFENVFDLVSLINGRK